MPSASKRPRLARSAAEWRELLTPEQFHVIRNHGTERAVTGPNWDASAVGTYACGCCAEPLFRSETKFDSGTGWPSFFAPVSPGSVDAATDRSSFMRRTEIRCARCEAHRGHVFDDGPKPTGLRYCRNGQALKLTPDDHAK